MPKRKQDDRDKDDVQAVAEEVAAAAAMEEDDDPNGSASKRRFFPRVKHLLTPEWEPFLTGVLDALDESGAPSAAAASHKVSNPWYKAFSLIYNGVARDCSVPHGKNRYHKFKDKIVELWQAIEAHTGDGLPQKARAMAQFEEYKKAVADAAVISPRKELFRKGGGGESSKKRVLWKHLDEAAALKSLPAPLQGLLQVKMLSAELDTPTSTELYNKALADYLKDIPSSKDALLKKSYGLAFLARYSYPKKDIVEAYDKVVNDYLVAMGGSTVTV